MSESSVRVRSSPTNCSGSLGTILSTVTTDPVLAAICAMVSSPLIGGSLPLLPPAMSIRPVSCFTLCGLATIIQCFHNVRLTSFSVRNFCDVMPRMYVVQPSPSYCEINLYS
ncbi:MAG: hypothetical protein Ct9H300mP7_5540 [Verrucomicrobiota bacterium]|nr:MAG: hypothetical protein Ct9H300mP7_5540 [Verrucomicrobiota bacterium]